MSLFMLRGEGAAYWLPAVADASGAPTETELAAGIPLHAGINALAGLEPQSNKINIALLKYREEAQIAGPTTFQDVSITVAEEKGSSADVDATQRKAILTTMTKDTTGVLILSRESQDPTSGDTVFSLAASVDDQVPNWTLDASAATTEIRLSPATPLRKVTVLA